MKILTGILSAALLFILTSCENHREEGASTPIDSTNTSGTAPATYGGENPASEQDTTYQNSNDTGTDVKMGPVKEEKRR